MYRKNQFAIGLLIILFLYNAGTLLFSAWNEGYVHDEPMYIEIGQMVLNEIQPQAGWGHPPLSVWTGSWLPWKLKHFNSFDRITLFQARLSHILLNLLVFISFAVILWKKLGRFAAVLGATLYSTLFLLKFVSAHHLTDSDSSLLAALAMIWAWAFPARKWWDIFIPIFLGVLATHCKLSLVVLLPSLLVGLWFRQTKRFPNWLWLLSLFGSFLISLSVTYRGVFKDFPQYFEILRIQMGRSAGGSPNSLMGHRIDSGIWYYYFVVGFFKTPFLLLGLFCGSLVYFKKNILSRSTWFLLLPSVLLFWIFSQSALQLGLRYITPVFVLMILYTTVAWNTLINKHRTLFIAIIFIVLLGWDFMTLRSGSYQTYFNPLTPRPTTNFTESNIDWNQHIPHHLQKLAPASRSVKDYLGFLMDDKMEATIFRTASMELNGIWRHPLGVVFRGLEPDLVIAGHEFHSVSKEKLFQLMMKRSPFHPSENPSFENWDKPFRLAPQCKSGQRFQLMSRGLLDLQSLIREGDEGSRTAEFEIPLRFEALKPSLIVMEANESLDLSLGSSYGKSPRGSLEEYQHYSYWLPYTPSKETEIATVNFERRTTKPIKEIKVEFRVFWAECV